MNDLAVRIARLEQERFRLRREIGKLADQAGYQDQRFRQLAESIGIAACSVTITGTMRGCPIAPSVTPSGIPSATFDVIDSLTSTTLYSFTTDGSGNIPGGATFTITGASVTALFRCSTYPSRWADGSVTLNCGTNSLGNFDLSPDGSHVCFGQCIVPLSKTLHLTDPRYGAQTLTYDSISGHWKLATTISYSASGPCSAVAALAVTYEYGYGLGLTITYKANAIGCPQNGGVNTIVETPTWGLSTVCPPTFSDSYSFTSPPAPNGIYKGLTGANLFTLSE